MEPQSKVLSSSICSKLKVFASSIISLSDKNLTYAVNSCLKKDLIRNDGNWLLFSKRFFLNVEKIEPPKEDIENRSSFNLEIEEAEKPKRGRPKIRKLFSKISDSDVVRYFKDTLKTAKKKCKELYEDITQYAVCFFNASFNVFAPDEEPMGKLAHYHRILDKSVENLPTRRTLSNHYKWFVDWTRAAIETAKERAERDKHILWEKFISWIQEYIMNITPQYALA